MSVKKKKSESQQIEELINTIGNLGSVESIKHTIKKFLESNKGAKLTFVKLADFINSEIEIDLTGIDEKYHDLIQELEEEVDTFLENVETEFHFELDGHEFDEIENKLVKLLKKNKVSNDDNLLNALHKIYNRINYLGLCEDKFSKFSIIYLSSQ